MTIYPRRELNGVSPYVLSDSIDDIQKKYGLCKVLRMSDNESVYGCSPLVAESIKEELPSIHFYPDGANSSLTKALSEYHQIESNHLIIGNGSDEIIRLLTRAYISKSDEAIMANITFPRYETNVVLEGGKAVKVPLIDGVHDLSGMIRAITTKTKMVFVCNPNNPTGTIVGKEELRSFLHEVPDNVLIILDEAYYEYVKNEDYLLSVPLLKQFPNLVILRTFSKIHGLAGLRVGYGIMNPELVQELHKVREVFNVNHLAQTAATAALKDLPFVQHVAEKNKEELNYVQSQLNILGISSFPTETNFLYAFSNYELYEKLLENGVLVRKMKLANYKEAFRITVGTREDNETFINVVKKLVQTKVVTSNGN